MRRFAALAAGAVLVAWLWPSDPPLRPVDAPPAAGGVAASTAHKKSGEDGRSSTLEQVNAIPLPVSGQSGVVISSPPVHEVQRSADT